MTDKKQALNEILEEIKILSNKIGRPVNLMEVCGTHTQTAAKCGLRTVLPSNVTLITGPGCPVCVTDQYDIDCVIELALNNISIATYGDMLRVPGTQMSLEKAREQGADVKIVYSTEDALKLSQENSDLVFFGLGFETTAPMSASAIKRGLTVYSTHKFFVPAIKALLDMGEINIHGFIGPGHVSAILGQEVYENLGVPLVITGFEPADMMMGILMLLRQIQENVPRVENEYLRVVKSEGNLNAWALIKEVFEYGDAFWRGFGNIPGSGMQIREEFSQYDAKKKYADILDQVSLDKSRRFRGCQCGEVVRGLIFPRACKLFGKVCNPDHPNGPCMVSQEGACNVAFRYGVDEY